MRITKLLFCSGVIGICIGGVQWVNGGWFLHDLYIMGHCVASFSQAANSAHRPCEAYADCRGETARSAAVNPSELLARLSPQRPVTSEEAFKVEVRRELWAAGLDHSDEAVESLVKACRTTGADVQTIVGVLFSYHHKF